MRTSPSMGRDMNPNQVRMDLDILIGAAGAVTSVRGYGLQDPVAVAVTHPATGRYVLTVDRRNAGPVVSVICGIRQATGVARIFPVHVDGDTFATDTVTIEVVAGTGTTLVDPASGNHIYVSIVLDELGFVVTQT